MRHSEVPMLSMCCNDDPFRRASQNILSVEVVLLNAGSNMGFEQATLKTAVIHMLLKS